MEVGTKRLIGCSAGCLSVPLVAVIVGVGGFQWWLASSRGRTAEYQRIARAAGQPFTSEDLVQFYQTPAGQRDVTKAFLKAAGPWKQSTYEIKSKALPIIGGGPGPKYGQVFQEQDACEAILQEQRARLDSLYSLVAADATCRFDINFQQGADGSVEHIKLIDAARRIVLLDAVVASRYGDAERTTRSLDAMFWLTNVVMREPSPLAQASGATQFKETCRFLADVLPHLEFDQSQLDLLSDRVSSFDSGEAIRRIIYGDRALALMIFDDPSRLFEKPEQVQEVQATIDADRAFFCSVMEKLLAISRLPTSERLPAATAAQDETATAMASWRGRIGFTMTRSLLPSLRAMMILPALAEASGESTRVAIATASFRLQHDKLPGSLAELDLSPPALDPFTAKPLRFVREGLRIKIYSLGANLQDDNGVWEIDSARQNSIRTMRTLDEIQAIDEGLELRFEE